MVELYREKKSEGESCYNCIESSRVNLSHGRIM